MHRSLVLVLVPFLVVLGCRREPVGDSNAASVAVSTGSSSELRERVAELGDGAPLVLVIHPERWDRARPHLATVLAEHPDAKVRAIAAAADPNAVLSAILDAAKPRPYDEPYDEPDDEREPSAPVAPPVVSIALAGWDLGRPVVMALGEPPVDGPLGTALAAYLGRTDLEPQRHQISIPATDRDTLVGALDRVLEPLGVPAPELVEGHPGARAWRSGGDYVAVLPQPAAVRVVVLEGAFGEPTPARLEAWRARLAPTPVPLPDTPALALAVTSEPLVAALVRPWRLRDWSTWTGFYHLGRALETVPRDQLVSALAMGASVATAADLGMSPGTVDVDDWAFALVADDTSLRLRAVASLTPGGRARWDEAWAEACGEAKADGGVARTFDALRGLAPPTPSRHPRIVPMFANVIQECGMACPMHMVLSQPFGLLPPARCDLLEGRGDASTLPVELFGRSTMATALRSLRDVRWQTRRDGDALVNETVLAFGEAASAVASSPGGARWDSPLGAAMVGSRDECMIEIIAGLRESLRALARDEPAAAAAAAARTLAELSPAFTCTSRDPAPAATARALRSAFVGLAARSIDDAYLEDAARRLLDESCREHEDAAACARIEALRPRPRRVPLALVEPIRCDPDRLVARGTVTIAVTAKGAWIGEVAYGDDLAAFERALAAARSEDDVLWGAVVFAEPSLTAAQVEPTLAALARAGAREIGVVVSEAGASPRILPLMLPERSPPPAGGGGEVEAEGTWGLYAMEGPRDPLAQMWGRRTTVLRLGVDDIELRTPTAARVPLRGSTPAQRRKALDDANDETGSVGLVVELDRATPWSRMGLALETSCDAELRLVVP
jgi:hypothetical protein